MSIKFVKIALIIALFWPLPAWAETKEIRFIFPLSCTPDQDCWLVNYNDSDPAKDVAKDYRCGPRTYDGHDGIDFALRDAAAMAAGVDVLAATEGKILRVRDEIEDREPSADDMKKMEEEKKGCGNGVLIDHGGGWQTIYCHMKKGSIAVKPGEQVTTGQKIGQAGQSGMAEFPHLHFGVFQDGKIIDPFTGTGNEGRCGAENSPLWLEGLAIDYAPVSFYAAGFKPSVPDFEDIKKDAGSNPHLPSAPEVLTFWFSLFGALEGDKIAVTITDPGGAVFSSRNIAQDKTRARQFYYIGKKIKSTPLMPGTYIGKAVLTRTMPDGETITREIERSIVVLP